MNWKEATGPELVRYFEGEDVWAKEWCRVEGHDAGLTDVHHGIELQLPIYQATFGGELKCFAAGEVSNGIHVFALPSP
jgi:hypothetical protein